MPPARADSLWPDGGVETHWEKAYQILYVKQAAGGAPFLHIPSGACGAFTVIAVGIPA